MTFKNLREQREKRQKLNNWYKGPSSQSIKIFSRVLTYSSTFYTQLIYNGPSWTSPIFSSTYNSLFLEKFSELRNDSHTFYPSNENADVNFLGGVPCLCFFSLFLLCFFALHILFFHFICVYWELKQCAQCRVSAATAAIVAGDQQYHHNHWAINKHLNFCPWMFKVFS